MQTSGTSTSTQALLEDAEPVVRTALRRKLHVSLRPNDYRENNLDALDLLQDVRLKLVRRLHSEPLADPESSAIAEFRSYAATVAYHACADFLRAKYPQRTHFRNALRRVIERSPDFALWEDRSGELLCGFAQWRDAAAPVDGARIAAIKADPALLLPRCWPGRSLEEMNLSQWQTVIEGVFRSTDSPLPLDDLIAVLAPILGVEDVHREETTRDDEKEGDAPDTQRSTEPSPLASWETKERLRLFWSAVLQLLAWHRQALVLNLRGGDLEVLPLYGIATVQQIGVALELKDKQYQIFTTYLPEFRIVATEPFPMRFLRLWPLLPLEDNAIAAALEVARSQVIAYRSKAKERLKRMLEGTL